MNRPFPLPGLLLPGFAILATSAALVLVSPEAASAQHSRRGGDGSAVGQSGDSGQSRPRAVPRGQRAPEGGRSNVKTDSDRGGGSRDGNASDGRSTRDDGARQGDTRDANAAGTTSGNGSDNQTNPVPSYSRPRDGRNTTGVAVERRPDSRRAETTVIVPVDRYYGAYPWGYGSLGFGSYYSGYYDPWWDVPYQSAAGYDSFEGTLRLKIKPRDASVYVDGYFAGRVDDFDGIFQALPIEPGPHRIEVRQDGYERLTFDVRILPDRKVTYEGKLTQLP